MSDIVERFNLSIHLGPTVVGEIRALEERIVRCGAEIKRLHNLAYAPDGKEMRKALFEEAEKRGNAEAEITRLRILVERKDKALRNVQKLISEAAMTGFNHKDGDWPERLFESQQVTSAALKATVSSDERA